MTNFVSDYSENNGIFTLNKIKTFQTKKKWIYETFCDVLSITYEKWLDFVSNPNSIGGGGQDRPCDTKFCEKCPCSHNNSTANNKYPCLILL